MYPGWLTFCSLVGATTAGFIFAQSPRQRATQLTALLALGAAWWALCEASWNAATDPVAARLWMQLASPGWAFIAGLLPHATCRYFDAYPGPEMERRRRLLWHAALFGYAAGAVMLPCLGLDLVYGKPVHVPWGWTYAPGPAQRVYFAVIGPPVTLAIRFALAGFRSPVAVAPRMQRVAVQVNVDRNVNVDVDDDWDNDHHPGAAVAVVGAAAAVGAAAGAAAACQPVYSGGVVVEKCP